MTIDRDRFMKDGYMIVRNAIPADKLEAVRSAYEVLVDLQKGIWAADRGESDPPEGVWATSAQPRLNLETMANLVDERSAMAIEAWLNPNIHGLSSTLLGVPDAAVTQMMLMCSPVKDHGPALWHRDMYPPYCAPLGGYIEDILEGGPRYIQWNIPLYDDDVLWVVPGSHIRVNSEEEDASIRSDPRVPLSGSIQTDLKAGDGVVYILPILHWGSNYTPLLRRCIHGGFSTFSQYEDLSFLNHLSDNTQAAFSRWDLRSEEMKEHTESALRAFMAGNKDGYFTALERLHPGRGDRGRALSTVFLSKTSKRIHSLKQPEFHTLPEQEQGWAERPHPGTLQWGRAFAARFSTAEAQRLWERFQQVDSLVQSSEPQYAPGFQGADSIYNFIEMPSTEAILAAV
jgi:ectoine hydroxylase-related dioxygenase (phytanoyl-CoA dioxygenase family)